MVTSYCHMISCDIMLSTKERGNDVSSYLIFGEQEGHNDTSDNKWRAHVFSENG